MPSLARPGKSQTAHLARTWCSLYPTTSERRHLLSKSCLCWPHSARLSSSRDGERREIRTIYSKRKRMAGRKEDRIHTCTTFLKKCLYISFFIKKKKNTGDKMIAIQMTTSGIGEHLSGRLCVQNLQSWGSIHGAMKRPLSGPRDPRSFGWRSRKRRAPLEDRGTVAVWWSLVPALLWGHHQELQSQVTVCIPKVCICALTQSPLWHHACLTTSVTDEDTLPKTPEETVAKGTRENFQETVFFVTHKGGTWPAWIPDASATGRHMPQYCIKQSKGHRLSWWCPGKREDVELFDGFAHLPRPGSHDPTLYKPMSRLFFLLAAARYIPACKSHWYKELSRLAVLMINLTRNPYISQKPLLSVYT